VISSASLILGIMPIFGREGARSGEAFTRSSVGAHVQCRGEGVQVSVHESLLLIVGVATLILGTLHSCSARAAPSRLLGIDHLVLVCVSWRARRATT